MSPEQALGAQSIDGRSDLWSVGAILFELLTGRRLLPRAGTDVSWAAARLPEVPRPRSLEPDCSRELEALCLRCLQRHPSDRLGSAEELLEDLVAWQQGRRLRSYTYSPVERLRHFARHNRRLFAVGVALVLVTIGGGVGLVRA